LKKKPKPRRVWRINPKTRVTPSKKIYHRPKGKKKLGDLANPIDWFGEG